MTVIPYRILVKLNSDTRFYQEMRVKTFDALKPGENVSTTQKESDKNLPKQGSFSRETKPVSKPTNRCHPTQNI